MDIDDVVDILFIFIGIGVLFFLLRWYYDVLILCRMFKLLGWWCYFINIYSVGLGFVFVFCFFINYIEFGYIFFIGISFFYVKKKEEKKKDFYGINENSR